MRLRFWKRDPERTCEGGMLRCGQRAVASVRVFGEQKHACLWHLEPAIDDREFWGIRFIARWVVPAPTITAD